MIPEGKESIVEEIRGRVNDVYEHDRLIDMLVYSFKKHNIGGKDVFTSPEGDLLDYVLMEEQYFIDNWLTQFAIGRIGEKSYFDLDYWNELTENLTKGVIILDSDNVPILIIPKFVGSNFTPDEQSFIDSKSRLAASAKDIPDQREVAQILNAFSQQITRVISAGRDYEDPLTKLIPVEYYQKHNINTEVLKQVIYIRDHFKYNGEAIEPESEVIGNIEKILLKNFNRENISKEEKNLINEITGGNFIFNSDSNTVDTKNSSPQEEEPFSPFED